MLTYIEPVIERSVFSAVVGYSPMVIVPPTIKALRPVGGPTEMDPIKLDSVNPFRPKGSCQAPSMEIANVTNARVISRVHDMEKRRLELPMIARKLAWTPDTGAEEQKHVKGMHELKKKQW